MMDDNELDYIISSYDMETIEMWSLIWKGKMQKYLSLLSYYWEVYRDYWVIWAICRRTIVIHEPSVIHETSVISEKPLVSETHTYTYTHTHNHKNTPVDSSKDPFDSLSFPISQFPFDLSLMRIFQMTLVFKRLMMSLLRRINLTTLIFYRLNLI